MSAGRDREGDGGGAASDRDREAIERRLDDLFEAERRALRLRDEVCAAPRGALVEAVARAVGRARAATDPAEAGARLASLASVLGELGGPRVVDLLVDVLGSDHPDARHAAGVALVGIALDRFKEVALGVERALERVAPGDPALGELPYVLAEVPEPGVARLLERFLAHRDPEAVAAGIEAAVEVGDAALARAVARLRDDARTVEMEDESGGPPAVVTIGELAREAADAFGDDGGPRAPERER